MNPSIKVDSSNSKYLWQKSNYMSRSKISFCEWVGTLETGHANLSITGTRTAHATLREYHFKLSKNGKEIEFSLYKTQAGKWYEPIFGLVSSGVGKEIEMLAKTEIEKGDYK